MRPVDALDKQIDLAKWLRTDLAQRYMAGFAQSFITKNTNARAQLQGSPLLAARGMRDQLAKADTYFMTRQIVHTLWSAASIKPLTAVLPQDLPTPNGFLVLESNIYFQDVHRRRMGVGAILWASNSAGVHVWYFTDPSDVEDFYMRDYRTTIPPELVGPYSLCHMDGQAWGHTPRMQQFNEINWDEVRRLAIEAGDEEGAATAYEEMDPEQFNAGLRSSLLVWQFLTTFWHFSRQQIVRPYKHAPDRWLRKRLRRADLQVTGDINVVVLRAEQPRESLPGDGSPVPWSHQWIVRGHWHPYWYSSEESALEHDAIVADTYSVPGKVKAYKYLAPYTKGPVDKPLLVKETVFNVKR